MSHNQCSLGGFGAANSTAAQVKNLLELLLTMLSAAERFGSPQNTVCKERQTISKIEKNCL